MNFDERYDRRNTNSVKYDFAAENGKRGDLLPMWVADMDFPSPEPVRKKLEEISRFGIFGYSEGKDGYFDAIYRWYSERFGWKPEKEWMLKTPGVVFAVAMAVRGLTGEGDGVMIQPPVYYPFAETIRHNHREIINNPLILDGGQYRMDLADMEEKFKTGKVKLLILCSPHNPVGRVWTKDELTAVGNLCLQYGVYVVSDEIHADFVYPGYRHFVFAGLSPEFAQNCVTCTAPSKTFNLAGLQASNIFIANREMRKKVHREIRSTGCDGLNLMGIAACQAAYEAGGSWLSELKLYLRENIDFLGAYLKENIPQIKLIEPQGTYLAWLDLRELGLSREEQTDLIEEKAKLWLDSGAMFGAEGEGFERMNIACPRATLEQALNQLKAAVNERL